MMDLIMDPDRTHQLIDLCTNLVIDWLKAQVKVIGNCAEGIFILDDIVGFVGEDDYKQFAHPYLKRICDAFPTDWVKIYHNDADVNSCLRHLPETGFNVLNWGKQTDISIVKEAVGEHMCLMGNVNPLETGVQGTPNEMYEATIEVLEKSQGQGIILSLGGGVSPGMPGENIRAMKKALDAFNKQL
jgi:uroporphyrinogen decarboxylase